VCEEGSFAFCPIVDEGLERADYEKSWLVVNRLGGEKGVDGYQIAEGDVIKIGRYKFRVKEINNDGTSEGNALEELISD
jgi:hypothetical protein